MGHIGMKYSLASRELIADSVETMAMAHAFDGLVLVPNCDKIVPGMVMAAVRMNLPTVVCSRRTYDVRPCKRRRDQPFKDVRSCRRQKGRYHRR